MKIIQIISADYLKKYATYLNDNIDNNLLTLSIIESQDIELQNIMGTNLYESYLYKIENDEIRASDLFSALDKHAFKVVLYSSINRSLLKMLIKFNNKNIGIKNSDNTEPIDIQTYNLIKSEIKNDFEYYSQRLIDFLNENGTDFEDFDTEDECDEINPNKKSNYSCGIDLTQNKYR